MKIAIMIIGMCMLILVGGCNYEQNCEKSNVEMRFIDNTSSELFEKHLNISKGERIDLKCKIENLATSDPEKVGDTYLMECPNLNFRCKVLNITYETEKVTCGGFEYTPYNVGLGDCHWGAEVVTISSAEIVTEIPEKVYSGNITIINKKNNSISQIPISVGINPPDNK